MPARGGDRPHHASCRCGHEVHTTHVVEPMCVCSSRIMCLRHAQGCAMVPPWCGQCFSWWLPHLSHLPPTPSLLKEQYGSFSLFLEETSICLRRHNGIINNYKLKFQVPQPSSAPPKSGAHAMPIWCTHDACLTRPQCTRGARLARSRCASGSPVVRARCTSGLPAASSHSPWSLNHQTSRISFLSS